jgi:F-type H+-transporting ATPase subunit b
MNLLMFASSNPVAEIADQFGVTWPLLISQTILFVIVAVALKKFAYGPVVKELQERRTKIEEGLANAEQMKQELANAQAKATEILTQANATGNKLIEEARQSAAKVLESETQKAVATANDIITKARQAGEAEVVRLKGELRKEFGRLVVATSAKVTGGILTPDQQSRMAEETSKQLASN